MNNENTKPLPSDSMIARILAEAQGKAMECTAGIIAAYVSNNPVSTNELPDLIGAVKGAITSSTDKPAEKLVPAVPIKKSLTDDYLICLEDGKQFKSLKRHLRTHYNLSPDEYRDKWGLPRDYPMVAPAYAKKRSDLAKQIGLGKNAA